MVCFKGCLGVSGFMPQVIKAVATYGRQDAYRLIGRARDLPQTAESIAWVIGELNDDQSDGKQFGWFCGHDWRGRR